MRLHATISTKRIAGVVLLLLLIAFLALATSPLMLANAGPSTLHAVDAVHWLRRRPWMGASVTTIDYMYAAGARTVEAA